MLGVRSVRCPLRYHVDRYSVLQSSPGWIITPLHVVLRTYLLSPPLKDAVVLWPPLELSYSFVSTLGNSILPLPQLVLLSCPYSGKRRAPPLRVSYSGACMIIVCRWWEGDAGLPHPGRRSISATLGSAHSAPLLPRPYLLWDFGPRGHNSPPSLGAASVLGAGRHNNSGR